MDFSPENALLLIRLRFWAIWVALVILNLVAMTIAAYAILRKK